MNKIHTFVICAYKESPFLEECIKSVIAQRDYSDVILVTSTPNDYIINLCRKYCIDYYINEGEKGITQDWTFGLEQVKTELATIAHQDDVYFNDYSKIIINEYRNAKRPIICFTDYCELRAGEYINKNRNLRIKRFLLAPLKMRWFRGIKIFKRAAISLGNAICCPSVAYCLNNINKPYFENHFKSNEDWEAWERYSRQKGEFAYIPKILMAHRIHEESETSAIINNGERTNEDYEMFKLFWPEWIARIITNKYKASEQSNNL